MKKKFPKTSKDSPNTRLWANFENKYREYEQHFDFAKSRLVRDALEKLSVLLIHAVVEGDPNGEYRVRALELFHELQKKYPTVIKELMNPRYVQDEQFNSFNLCGAITNAAEKAQK